MADSLRLKDATIGIITALTHEHSAVCEVFDLNEKDYAPGHSALRAYDLGRVAAADQGSHLIAAAQLPIMGNNSASARATIMLEHCKNMRVVIMVGISGAVPHLKKPDHHVRLGDIVVINEKGIVQYDNVKRLLVPAENSAPNHDSIQTEIRSPARPPSPALLVAAHSLEVQRIRRNRRPWDTHADAAIKSLGKPWNRPPQNADLLHEWEGGHPTLKVHPIDPDRTDPDHPKVFQGPIASANILLKDPILRDSLRDRFGVKAVEMEASGIADAAWFAEADYFVVRGTCDYCDPTKGDQWQKYAAIVAAGYARALIESLPSFSVPESPAEENSTLSAQLLNLVRNLNPDNKIRLDISLAPAQNSGTPISQKVNSNLQEQNSSKTDFIETSKLNIFSIEQASAEIEASNFNAESIETLGEKTFDDLKGLLDNYEVDRAFSKVATHEKWLETTGLALSRTVAAEHYYLLASVALAKARMIAGDGSPDILQAREFIRKAKNVLSIK